MAYDPPDEVGEHHPKISDAKAFLGKRYAYARLENLGDTDVDDTITPGFERAFRQYRINIHYQFIKGTLPRDMVDMDPANPDFDWRAQKNMKLLPASSMPPPVPGIPKYFGCSWTGTWGAWDNGYGWHTLRRAKERNHGKLDIHGLVYNTTAFMMGDPSHSYIDMLVDGSNAGLHVNLPERRPKVWTGYSGGSGCLVETLRRWPADRRHEVALILQFGDPNRPPGTTKLGKNYPGHGISEDFPPDWCLDRYYSFNKPGDMYPNAVGLLPIFYDILVRMEASLDFMMYLFGIMVDQIGNLTPFGMLGLGVGGNSSIPGFGALAGLLPLITGGIGGATGGGGLLGGLLGGGGGMLGGLLGGAPQTSNPIPGAGGQRINLVAMMLNIPAIIQSLIALLQFLITGDHGKYHLGNDFDGLSAEDRAIELILALP